MVSRPAVDGTAVLVTRSSTERHAAPVVHVAPAGLNKARVHLAEHDGWHRPAHVACATLAGYDPHGAIGLSSSKVGARHSGSGGLSPGGEQPHARPSSGERGSPGAGGGGSLSQIPHRDDRSGGHDP